MKTYVRQPFHSLNEGDYFRSIYTKALFVKRTSWYAEPILLSGLADNSACFEFGRNSEVEVVECESDWPTINYRPQIEAWNWAKIEEDLKQNIYLDEEKQPYGSCFVGTQLTLMPSGKIYAMWTSNQTVEDVNRDQQWNEALEAVLNEKGYWADWESGDLRICKRWTFEEVARMKGFDLGEYCGHYSWTEVKPGSMNSSVPFASEDEAWEDCCRENNLVDGM